MRHLALFFILGLSACGYDFVTVPPDTAFENDEFAPTDIKAHEADPYGVRISWRNQAQNETSFQIERRHANNSTEEFVPVGIAAADSITWADQNVATDTTYEYRVVVYQGAIALGRSESVEVYIPTYKPELLFEYATPTTYDIVDAWVPPFGTSGNVLVAGASLNKIVHYYVIKSETISTEIEVPSRFDTSVFSVITNFQFTGGGLFLTGLRRNETGSRIVARLWRYQSGNAGLLDSKDYAYTDAVNYAQEADGSAELTKFNLFSNAHSVVFNNDVSSTAAVNITRLLAKSYDNAPKTFTTQGFCRFDRLVGGNWCGVLDIELGNYSVIAPIPDQRVFVSGGTGNYVLAEPDQGTSLVRVDTDALASTKYTRFDSDGELYWGRNASGGFDLFQSLKDFRDGVGTNSESEIEPNPEVYQYTASIGNRTITVSCGDDIEVAVGSRILDTLDIDVCPKFARLLSGERLLVLNDDNVLQLWNLGPRFNSVEGNSIPNYSLEDTAETDTEAE